MPTTSATSASPERNRILESKYRLLLIVEPEATVTKLNEDEVNRLIPCRYFGGPSANGMSRALGRSSGSHQTDRNGRRKGEGLPFQAALLARRSEEHTSELQSLMRNSYAVFCLNKKTQ